MKKQISICVIALWAMTGLTLAQTPTITGPNSICPYSQGNIYTISNIGTNCRVEWSTNKPTYVDVSGGNTSASIDSEIDPESALSVALKAMVICTTSTEPQVIDTTNYNYNFTVQGVGQPTLTSNTSSFACAPGQVNFTVTASATNANSYSWSVTGGTIVSSTANTVTVSSTGCNKSVNVTANAKRSECPNYSGRFGSISIGTQNSGGSLPTSITGPDGLCEYAPNNSVVYSVSAGANSCTTYNWYFDPATTAVSITNGNTATPTLTVNANPAEGYKYLKCTVNTCGASTTLQKRITVCKAVTTPTDIVASRQGTSCYYKFTSSGGCASSWQWQVNGGAIETSTINVITPYEPGYYTVKVRNVNACGTSAWRTETFNLPNITSNPPCMWKTDSNDGSEASGSEMDPDMLQFDIYPNPSNGDEEVIIHCSNELRDGTFEIYDLTGKKFMEGSIDGSKAMVQVKELNAGLYFCRVSNGKVHTMKKFIVSF